MSTSYEATVTEWIVNKTENWVVKIPPVTQQFAHIYFPELECKHSNVMKFTVARKHVSTLSARTHRVHYITAAFRCIHKNTQPNSCLRPRFNECDAYHNSAIHTAHIAHTNVDRWLCSKSFLHVDDPITVEWITQMCEYISGWQVKNILYCARRTVPLDRTSYPSKHSVNFNSFAWEEVWTTGAPYDFFTFFVFVVCLPLSAAIKIKIRHLHDRRT